MTPGLTNKRQVRSAYAEIMDNAGRYDAGARLDGVLVQPMAAGDADLGWPGRMPQPPWTGL